jgi:hypothetical protein
MPFMARLLRLFLILALVTTQGTAMAQAVCRHQNAHEHMLARASLDAKVASVSIREDAAAATAAKKGSQFADASSHWPAEMLPTKVEPQPLPSSEPSRLRPARQSALSSASVLPLLKPPSA